MGRTKISKGKIKWRWYDTGAPPQAWRKPRGVPIPDTQFSFGDEEGGGGDEVVAILSFMIKRFSSLRMTLGGRRCALPTEYFHE